MDDSIKKLALEIGSAMNSSGSMQGTIEADPFKLDKEQVKERTESGQFMPIEQRHATNYDEITASARGMGTSSIQVMLDTANNGSDPVSTTLRLGKDDAVVVVNGAALKGTPELVTDLANYKVKQGTYIELDPTLAENYQQLARLSDTYAKPPRVMFDTNDTGAVANTSLQIGSEGEPFIVANGRAVKITTKFAHDHILLSDEQLAQSGLKNLSQDGLPKGLDAYVSKSAAGRNVEKPGIYLDDTDESAVPNALARETQSGKPFIIVNSAFVKSNQRYQEAILDHELAHIELGQTHAENFALLYNEGRLGVFESTSRLQETAADRTAVLDSPTPTKTRGDLIDFFNGAAITSDKMLHKENPKLNHLEVLKKVYQTTEHPALNDRVKDLQDLGDVSHVPRPPNTPVGPQATEEKGRDH